MNPRLGFNPYYTILLTLTIGRVIVCFDGIVNIDRGGRWVGVSRGELIMDHGSRCLNFVQIDVMKITSILVTQSYFSVFRKKSGG